MDSSGQELCYADLHQEVEDVLINSPPPMRLEPKELGLVRLDDDASSYYSNELDDGNGLRAFFHKRSSSVDNSFGLHQSNFALSRCWDPWMFLPSTRPDDDLSLTVDSPIEEPTSELEEADFTSTESSSSMDSLSVFETNSASYHSWSQCVIQQDLEENVPVNFDLPTQQPPTVALSEKSVVEQQMVENLEEPLHEVAQKVAVATEEKAYRKPKLSHTCLTALALKNSKAGRLCVTQIYSFMKLHFPYFENARPGWKNAVRHNLSNNECFKKIETVVGGCIIQRGSLWEIQSAHATKIDEQLRTQTKNREQKIREAMRHPESLDRLVNGEMNSSFPEVTMRRAAKRRENGDGEAQLSYVYPPAKRTKTVLTVNATAEE